MFHYYTFLFWFVLFFSPNEEIQKWCSKFCIWQKPNQVLRYLSIEQRVWHSDSISFRKSFGHCRYGRRLEILSDRLPYSSSTYARHTWIYFYHSKSLVTRSFSRKFLSDLVQWTCRHPPAFSMGAWYKTLWILVIAMILTGIMRFCQYESYPAAFAKLSVLWPLSKPNLSQNCQQIENPCEQRFVLKRTHPQWVIVISTGDLVKLTGHSVVENRFTSEGKEQFLDPISQNKPSAYFCSAELAKKGLSVLQFLIFL